MTFSLPTVKADNLLATIMWPEYAEEAARRDTVIEVRKIYDRANTALAKARNELRILELSDAAYTNRPVYYTNCARLHAKIAREMEKLSAIYASYADEARYW